MSISESGMQGLQKKKSDEVKRSTLHLYLTTETKAIKQFLKQQ